METITKEKSAIFGKIWVTGKKDLIPAQFVMPTDMIFEPDTSYLIGNMSLRTDRNLKHSIEVKASQKLFLFANNKRTERDPDYSVSVRMPEAEANELIEYSQMKAQEWRDAHPQA